MVFTDVPVSMAVASTPRVLWNEVFTDDLVSFTGTRVRWARRFEHVALIAAASCGDPRLPWRRSWLHAAIVASMARWGFTWRRWWLPGGGGGFHGVGGASRRRGWPCHEAASHVERGFHGVAAMEADTGKTI